MLVLSRKKDETILIGDNIKITVVEVRGNKVRLSIDAPRDIRILREEVAPHVESTAEEPTTVKELSA